MRANQTWRLRGACLDSDPDLFFVKATKAAKAICERCPVKAICLEEAYEEERPEPGEGVFRNRELRAGVRGGMTAIERWEHDFPAEAAHFAAREAARLERLKVYKRERYAAMTPEERKAERGKIDTPEKRELKRARDRRALAKTRS